MQTKNKVRDNIINEAESNNKDPRLPLAGSESSSITRIYDGTARVQTVTREENEWLYDLLTEMDAKTGIGVLLNTSFTASNHTSLCIKVVRS